MHMYIKGCLENLSLLSQKLNEFDWEVVTQKADVNVSYCTFLQFFSDAYNDTCPVIKVKQNKVNHKPWLTPGLANACKKKNHMYKSFIKHRTAQAENKYKQYKNKLISILRKAEKAYYCNKLDEYKSDLKGTWKIYTKKKETKCVYK